MKKILFVAIAWLATTTFVQGQETGTKLQSYEGTGSVARGKATTTVTNLFDRGIRIAAVGTIKSSDGKTWTVPASVAFSNPSFPFAPDLYNQYVKGHTYKTSDEAERALFESQNVTVDVEGDVYTAYIFADNYFEMYINGVPVGKDAVPFTDFNSSIVRFRVKKPFTIAIQCVDWEENLGLGTERMGDDGQHIGDGGFVAVIKNSAGNIEVITDTSWKAQTFYTAPIADLSCLREENGYRYSAQCIGTNRTPESYGIHWELPSQWFSTSFDDLVWPSASLFRNETVGVDNKPSYTNFTNVFDDAKHDASFIWSTNLLLDNVVLLRKKVQ